MKRPTNVQIETAVEWLMNNEGDGAEGEACRAVADWIEHLAKEAFIRETARECGVTPAAFRRKLAAMQQSA
jgi:hypothetical protein